MNFDINQFIRELEVLVNIDSGFGAPEGISALEDFFQQRFEAMGWICERPGPDTPVGRCLVVKNREAEHYDALLVGHLDTVFPKGEAGKRPFRMDEKRAYGVGVLDMKQGCLAMLHVLEHLPECANQDLNITAIFNADEETGSTYSKELIDSYAVKSDYAYVFEAASTDGSCTVQRKGMYRACVHFHGKAGHSGYLFDGGMISAVNELLYWGEKLNTHLSAEKGTSVNIGLIRGGQAVNIVPDYAEMTFEARFESTDEYQKLLATLSELKLHAKETGIGIEFTDERATPPMLPDERTLKYVERIRALAAANGIAFKVKKRGGLSDANHIRSCGPICLDGLAPTGDCDHSEWEYLELSTIDTYLRLVLLILTDLAEEKRKQ